jgi:hypothetical protein
MKATISKAFIALMVPVAGWVGASEPMVWATPQAGQPALLASLPEPISVVSAHAGDGQAQEVVALCSKTHNPLLCPKGHNSAVSPVGYGQ